MPAIKIEKSKGVFDEELMDKQVFARSKTVALEKPAHNLLESSASK
jgi:hypothetical protein